MKIKGDIYKQKVLWKWILFVSGAIIVFISLYYTNNIVRKIASEERKKVALWADAIQRKAALVNYTNDFFLKIESEERKRVELWYEAMQRMIHADLHEDLTFYSKIIRENSLIPIILTDEENRIITTTNTYINTDSIKVLEGALLEEFSQNPPLIIHDARFGNVKNKLYFNESIIFTELRLVLNDLIDSFFSEILTNNPGVPVIITNTDKNTVLSYGNIDSELIKDTTFLRETIENMSSSNLPIEIDLPGFEKKLIFYQDSFLLTQLRFYPYIQFIIIGIFLMVAYILFSISRHSEQNQVWVGMAKETAHQLGTPISSMIAWVELLKEQSGSSAIIKEFTEDIKRLENITERFSKIGSKPELVDQNIYRILENSVNYISARTSKKVNVVLSGETNICAPVNENLFLWVVENICKNAIDAMDGVGDLTLHIEYTTDNKYINIDITDTGKGIAKSKQKRIFMPGYSTKSRGWGLGLTLAKRIIVNYHNGKLFVKQSVVNKGTTFRIVLRKCSSEKLIKKNKT